MPVRIVVLSHRERGTRNADLCAVARNHRIDKLAPRIVAFAGLIALLPAVASCAIPTRVAELNMEIPKKATPVALQAAIEAIDDPATKRRVQKMLASSEMRAIQQELVGGLVDGTLATLSDEERAERIGAMTSKAMVSVLRGASREIGPMAAEMTRGAMNGALDAALDPKRQRDLEGSVGTVVSTSVRSAAEGLRDAEIGKSLASAMTEQVGPALEKTLRDDLSPGLAALLKNEELNQALGATARVLGREMVIGATEALAKAQPKEDGSLLSRGTELARQGARLFGSAAWLLLLVVVGLFVWILKLRAQTNRYREESDRRAATARFIAEATKASEGKAWSGELLGALQERIRAEEEAIAELRRTKSARSRDKKQEAPPAGRARPSLA